MAKFEKAVQHVINLQQSYRKVLFRRVVRRTLMEGVWEKFVDEQKRLSMQAELTFKKQTQQSSKDASTTSKKKGSKKEQAAAAAQQH